MATNSLAKRDVIKSWFNWFMFAQSNYNYERLQATAFAHSMLPIIKKLYKSPEEQKEGIKRHLSFFNTETICGSVIHGVTVAMEEERANGKPISDQAFTDAGAVLSVSVSKAEADDVARLVTDLTSGRATIDWNT